MFISVNDGYQMASLCYDNAEFHGAYAWFDQVYRKYKEGNNEPTFDYETLVTKYVWSSYLVGEW